MPEHERGGWMESHATHNLGAWWRKLSDLISVSFLHDSYSNFRSLISWHHFGSNDSFCGCRSQCRMSKEETYRSAVEQAFHSLHVWENGKGSKICSAKWIMTSTPTVWLYFLFRWMCESWVSVFLFHILSTHFGPRLVVKGDFSLHFLSHVKWISQVTKTMHTNSDWLSGTQMKQQQQQFSQCGIDLGGFGVVWMKQRLTMPSQIGHWTSMLVY